MDFVPAQICGVFGGTFDPIHCGHISTVRQVMGATGIKEVRFIPASIPPHRPPPDVSPKQRLKMVQIALNGESGLILDNREIIRSGRSFTIDTVESLQNEFPRTNFYLILGLDALIGFDQWHRWQELLEMVGIVAMVRPGWGLPKPLPDWWQQNSTGQVEKPVEIRDHKITLIPIDPNPLSATYIRARIHANRDVSGLLHPGVINYIKMHKLYE